MSEDLSPWDVHPDLTESRLSAFADMVADARHECFETTPWTDDAPWGMGCLAYDLTRARLIRESKRLSWLSIVDGSLRFIFKIGAVPVRFYRGEGDDPPPRKLMQSHPELQQLSLAFAKPAQQELQELVWRFAIETGPTGEVDRVVFFGASQAGEILCRWSKTLAPRVAKVIPYPVRVSGDGVDLAPPSVGIPGAAEEQEREA